MPFIAVEEVVNMAEDISNTAASALTAADRVFGTAELLEMILQHCSAADCTRFQRLTTFCRAAIPGTSTTLRRIMFLEPTSSETELLTLEGEIVSRSTASQIRYPALPTSYDKALRTVRERERRPHVIGRVHPALGLVRLRIKSGIVMFIHGLGIEKWERGCWEKMSITQPPCRKASIWMGTSTKHEVVNLGQLRDAVVERFGKGGSVRVFLPGFLDEGSERVRLAREQVATARLTEQLREQEE